MNDHTVFVGDKSYRNVFEASGNKNADELALKATLAAKLLKHIDSEHMDYPTAAIALGCTAGDVENICTGKLSSYSSDFLMHCLVSAGFGIDISVAENAGDSARIVVHG